MNRPLSAAQQAILRDVRKRPKHRGPLTLEEATEVWDGRSFWPLVHRGLLVITTHCGCGHPCNCALTYVTAASKES